MGNSQSESIWATALHPGSRAVRVMGKSSSCLSLSFPFFFPGFSIAPAFSSFLVESCFLLLVLKWKVISYDILLMPGALPTGSTQRMPNVFYSLVCFYIFLFIFFPELWILVAYSTTQNPSCLCFIYWSDQCVSSQPPLLINNDEHFNPIKFQLCYL